eukprot:COSAG01_NODE_50607_length_362_cov_0.520913_1_plen_40_part_01
MRGGWRCWLAGAVLRDGRRKPTIVRPSDRAGANRHAITAA